MVWRFHFTSTAVCWPGLLLMLFGPIQRHYRRKSVPCAGSTTKQLCTGSTTKQPLNNMFSGAGLVSPKHGAVYEFVLRFRSKRVVLMVQCCFAANMRAPKLIGTSAVDVKWKRHSRFTMLAGLMCGCFSTLLYFASCSENNTFVQTRILKFFRRLVGDFLMKEILKEFAKQTVTA